MERFGSDSSEAKRVNVKLAAALQASSAKGGDTMLYAKKLFQLSQQTMSSTDPRRVGATIHMAEAYQARDDSYTAEELLVDLWKQITDESRNDSSIEQIKFGVAVAYIEFLQRSGRDNEAISMLLGLWTDFEQIEPATEADTDRLRHLQDMLQSTGQHAVALSALTTLWKWHVKSGRQYSDSDDASIIASTIAHTVQAIQEQDESIGTSSTVMQSSPADAILQEVIDMGILNSAAGQPSASTVKICESSSASLIRQKRWAEAISALYKALRLIWPSFMIQPEDLPSNLQDEAIAFADRLADCLVQENRFDEALQVRLTVYEASKNLADSGPMARTSQSLIQHYNDRDQTIKAIDVHDDLLQRYRGELGQAHPITIQALYALGSLCESVDQLDSAGKYYQQIILSLNDASASTCHPDAIKAALRLSELYTKQGNWTMAVEVCRPLWNTVLEDGPEDVMAPATLQAIYERYATALRQTSEGTAPNLRKAAEQFWHVCTKVLPHQSSVALKAAFSLAEMSERIEHHQIDAIRVYEQIIKAARSSPDPDDPEMVQCISTAKDRLAELYRSMSLASSKSFTEVVQDAIALYNEKYEDAKAGLGLCDDTTLQRLADLIHLYTQNDTGRSRAAALDLLQNVAAGIISNETSPFRLWKSAAKLATIYSDQGYNEQGLSIVDALRRQIIMEDTTQKDDFTVVLDRSLDRRCYIFITTLEQGLRGSEKLDFSQSMSDLLTETLLYERFSHSTVLGEKLLHGARLRTFLLNKKRFSEVQILESRALEALLGAGLSAKMTERVLQQILTATLNELGKDGDSSTAWAVSAAGNNLVKNLIEREDFGEVYTVAKSVFELCRSLRAYEDPRTIVYGLKLSLYLAELPGNEALQGLSSNVLREVLGTCKRLKLSIGQMDLQELKDLVGILGDSTAELEVSPHLLSYLSSSSLTFSCFTDDQCCYLLTQFPLSLFVPCPLLSISVVVLIPPAWQPAGKTFSRIKVFPSLELLLTICSGC